MPGYNAREIKQRKEGGTSRAVHNAEKDIEDVPFSYDDLSDNQKKHIDWLIDDCELDDDFAYKGLTVVEASLIISNGFLPVGMEVDDLIEWIKCLQSNS